MRGAGVRGLSAMPAQRALGRGTLLRPLLDVTRSELEVYAHAHQLRWIEDPSNQNRQYSRNYLRHQVLPALTERWPQAQAQCPWRLFYRQWCWAGLFGFMSFRR